VATMLFHDLVIPWSWATSENLINVWHIMHLIISLTWWFLIPSRIFSCGCRYKYWISFSLYMCVWVSSITMVYITPAVTSKNTSGTLQINFIYWASKDQNVHVNYCPRCYWSDNLLGIITMRTWEILQFASACLYMWPLFLYTNLIWSQVWEYHAPTT